MDISLGLAVAGGALAAALAGIGSAIGIGIAAEAADGLLSEEPGKFGNALILVALPGTQGFYGFILCFLIIMKTGLLGGQIPVITISQGLQILGVCLPVGLVQLYSAIHQGKASAAGIGVIAKQPKALMQAVTLSALIETYAIIGLLTGILFLNGIKI
ncbi:MAG: V-type ATP synthase subunit K [Candidatus Ratteibacteria bacterium]|nr:V-type ATP synthase subunit K [Candidatus Ratteibacteria bacterium]